VSIDKCRFWWVPAQIAKSPELHMVIWKGGERKMAVEETVTPEHVHEQALQWEHSALTTELLIALGAVVLSIIAIVGVLPTQLAAIAVIAMGAMMLFQGAAVALHYSELLYEAGATHRADTMEGTQGVATEFLAGTAGIILGVLALVGLQPTTLMSVAVIAYGGSLLLTSGEMTWRNSLMARESEPMRQIMRQIGSAAAGAQLLVGLTGIILGILGLVGMSAIMMILVAILATGTLILLRSSAVGGLMLEFLRR
jgi:hypothetical protein